MNRAPRVEQVMLKDDGTFPGNPCLPLLLYPGELLPFGPDAAADVESRFNANGWPAAWRDGIYGFHHYHSEAHEALGVCRGLAKVQFGGPGGPLIQVRAGDAAVLPAGTTHKLIDASPDFAVVGAYPPGQSPDMCHGKSGERPGADERIARVPTPDTDPVFGSHGGLLQAWRTSEP